MRYVFGSNALSNESLNRDTPQRGTRLSHGSNLHSVPRCRPFSRLVIIQGKDMKWL